MRRLLLFALCYICCISAINAQTYTTISTGNVVTNTGVDYNLSGGFFVANGTYTVTTATPSAFNVNGGVTFSGTGAVTAYNFNLNSGSSVLNSLVSSYNTATIASGATLNANTGNLYLRTDLNPSANLVNNGFLTGTVQGLVTNATATSGACTGYSSTLSMNVSGTSMNYQWQSSPDNTTWTSVGSANATTYAATVTVPVYYRCLLTTNNTAYSQTTPGVLLNSNAPGITLSSATAPTTCSSSSTTLNYTNTINSPTSYTITWSGAATTAGFPSTNTGAITGTSGTITIPTPALTPANGGTYTGVLTVSNSGCTGAGTTITVVVNTLPSPFTPTIATPNPSCVSNGISLSGNVVDGSALSYSWNSPNGDLVSTNTLNTSISSAVLADDGTYTLTVTATGCTGNTTGITTTLAVGVLPTSVTAAVTPNPACVGEVVTLTGGDSGDGALLSYSWSSPNSDLVSSNSQSTSINSAVLPDDGTYTLTETAAGCTGSTMGSTSVLAVGVLPTTVTAAVTPNPACVGGVVTLTGGDSGDGALLSYSWSSPNSDLVSSNSQSTSINSAVLPDDGTYTLTETAAGCTGSTMGSTSVLAVGVLPTTVTAAVTPNPACVGGVVTLTGGDSGDGALLSYSWSSPNSDLVSSNSQSTSINSAVLPDDGTYTLTETAAGCSSSRMGSTSVLAVGVLPTSVTAAVTPNPACVGGVVTLTGGDSGDGALLSYSWSSPNSDLVSSNSQSTSINSAVLLDDGTYTLTETATGCTGSTMGSTSVLAVGVLPTSVTAAVTPNPTCVGSTITLTGGDSGDGALLSYSWSSPNGDLVNASAQSTSIALAVSLDAGTYTLTETAAGCTGNTFGSSASEVINPTPTTITNNTPMCNTSPGGSISLTESATGGTWSSSNTNVATVDGSGNVYSTGSGNSTITYTNGGAGCSTATTVTVNVLPVPTFITSSPGANSCQGSTVTYTTQSGETNYQWSYPGTVTFVSGGTVTSNSLTVTFGNTGSQLVTVNYTDLNGCTAANPSDNTTLVNALPGSVSVSDLNPTPYCGSTTLTATGGSGGTIYFENTTSNGTSTVSPYSGSQLVSSTGTNTFYFRAQSAAGCWGTQGSIPVTITALPTAYTVTGGGTYCTGGINVGLSNSQNGVTYELYINGTPSASFNGTGSAIPFGVQSTSGTYSVIATNNTSLCTNNMLNVVTVNQSTVPLVHNVTGGGFYCAGGAGEDIGLDGSESGISYQLYNNGSPVGTLVTGTGGSVDFGVALGVSTFTANGTYTVVGNPGSMCATNMAGDAVISIAPAPSIYTVSGSGSFCAGGTGVDVTLSESQSGVNYQLYDGSGIVGSVKPGTGFELDFGNQAPATNETYYILGETVSSSCVNTMSLSAVVVVNPLPTLENVLGTGGYCSGATGLVVGLNATQSGVSYQLLKNGFATGTAETPGTTVGYSFPGTQTSGTFTVGAQIVATGCTSTMTGSAIITENALPTVFNVTGGGGYCTGTGGVSVGLSFTNGGIHYQLYEVGVGAIGSYQSGTGAAITFPGLQTAGTYSVSATDATSLCSTAMNGEVTATVNALPTPMAVSAGGDYCVGGSGVDINMAASQSGISYQLWLGSSAVGTPLIGGGALDFGSQTATGTYSIIGTNISTLCTNSMTGNPVIGTYPLPALGTVTGGGSNCAGAGGVDVGVSGTVSGVLYHLYLGGSTLVTTITATGATVDFGDQNTSGVYTVVADNGTCTRNMTGSATVQINTLPTAYTMTGGGTICAGATGVHVGLSGSAIASATISYQLYINGVATGSPLTGDGFGLDFGVQNTNGIYTASAINTTTGCASNMTGTVSVTVNALPAAYVVSGGGGYCSGGTGVTINLSNTQSGVNYQLLNGGVPQGSVVAGTGSGYNFINETIAGLYTVAATTASTTCTNTMTGNATITVNPLPTVYTVTGGGSYCVGGTGVHIGLNSSAGGTSYQLFNSAGPGAVATLSGTGSALDFGLQTTIASYSVVATNASLCTTNMSGVVTVTTTPLPVNTYAVLAGGLASNSYCSGGTGLAVTLNGSTAGISYQLYLAGSPVGTPVIGGGGTVSFGNQTGAGNYTVIGTNTSTGCTAQMTGGSGFATISINALPALFTVTGGGSYCSGSTGVAVGLSSSTSGVSYQLYDGGVAVSGSGYIASSPGGVLTFGNQTGAGIYTVVANNGCTQTMTGSVMVTINPLPTAYTVTGGGSLCSGGTGVDVSLSGSNIGINYQLLNGGLSVGTPVGGSGFALDFGLQTAGGNYTVSAINTTTFCTNNMSSVAVVTVNSLPTAYSVTGGGGYCPGGSGVHVGLANSTTGVSYQLYLAGSPVGSPQSGTTGSAIDFGLQTGTGIYTVVGTGGTSCTNTMSGSATVFINTPPTAYTVTGGGSYCPSGSGVVVGLSSSATGVNYQLYVGSLPVTGGLLSGTGFALSFGSQLAAGNYTVIGTNTSTTCVSTMSGSVNVVISPSPTSYTVTGGGSYCAGGTGVDVSLSGTQTSTNYQLFRSGSPAGSPVGGSGFPYDFGNQTLAGNYTVSAINTITGCTSNMTGSVTVTVNALPTAFIVTGGGSYCSGGTGVDVALSGTQSGVTYQLLRGGIPVGSSISGTGSAYDFGNETIAGIYTVSAMTASTTCTNTMTGNATVTINPLPTVYVVTGGGSYCAGGTGVHVGLSNSATGMTYQLYNGAGAVGSVLAGTGSPLDFGLQTTVGTYSVVATNTATTCTNNMAGTVSVTTTPLPTVFNVGGGGSYCVGGTGVAITLSGSTAGVNYQLYNGSSPVGSPVAGTNFALNFGLQTATGTYSVSATNATTTCTQGMSGGVVVSTTPLPTAYAVTGTGSYCAGGTGVVIGLSSSASGISYQLYLGSSAIGAAVAGTSSPITFGLQTAAGTYTVLATNITTTCTNEMNGGATISINPLPTPYSVTGGGSFCSGGTGVSVGLSSSTTGISYQLYDNGSVEGPAVIGTGTALTFGLQTAGGTYTVVATNTTTGCTNMMTGSEIVTVNALPTAYAITGGGGYCVGSAGVDISLSGSQIGVSYQLYLNGIPNGTAAAGTGAALDYGLRTVAGTYTIIANNSTTSCSAAMTGSAVIVVNPLPTVYTVTGGGSYCAGGTGVHIGLSNSTTGVNYQLYSGAVAIGTAVAGDGAAIDFGLVAAVGTYTVLATNATSGCTQGMSGSASIIINPLPTVYAVTGGGSYCAGGAGVHIGLSNSDLGVSYQLYYGSASSGVAVAGTGAAIDFGLKTVAGSYMVVATNTATACTNNMSGSATITINALPTVYSVTGGGSYCAGGTGLPVGLSNSATGVNYQLYDGSGAVGTVVAGTGSAISFGLQMAAGTYSVVATSATTGCTNNMSGTVTVTINALPAVYTVTGGGNYCAGGAGLHVGLSNSTIGISYQLYDNGVATGGLVPGTGSALDFGALTAAGTYSVTAMNVPTGCVSNMNGSVSIAIDPLPTVYSVSGGGSYCAGGTGSDIQLSNSQTGVNYQLYNGSSLVSTMAGTTGVAVDFGSQIAAGTYTVSAVNATTGCTSNMSGSVSVSINALPTVYNVTGGGSYCFGGSGQHIGLSNSTLGISYKLYNGSTLVTTKTGTGSAIDFGAQTGAGTYSVTALNIPTGCTQNMSGSVIITVNPLPTAHNVTGGVSSYCAGGSGVAIGLNTSDAGIAYQLYNGTSVVGSAVAGTNAAISFGNQLAAGTYTVLATNTTTGCSNVMSGDAVITITSLPIVYTVTGGGGYCAGGPGVAVGLSGSQTSATSYILYNGTSPVSGLLGNNSALNFTDQPAGSYTVIAAIGSCTVTMSGTAVVTENPLPIAYNVTGGGNYCAGSAGSHVGLNGSHTGISYQLFNGTSPSGSAVAGTGSSLDFGLRTATGNYTVTATDNTTGCTSNMNNSVTIGINAVPNIYAVTGGGSYCAGGNGVDVGLGGSDIGTSYQLYNGSVAVGTPTVSVGGTIDFGDQPAGSYTVIANNGCTSNMSGIVTVTMNPLPAAFAVTGGGSYCSGSTGIVVGLGGSATGISYQLYNSAGAVGSPVAGTGSAISFGAQTAQDVYSVVATNVTTTCTQNMTGTATVTINALPTVYNVNGGGSYCAGGTGVDVSLSGSDAGISYQLYNGSAHAGAAQLAAGPGGIDFGLQTAAGTYIVIATNPHTNCASDMGGSVVVSVNALPHAYTLISSASAYCAGGTGVDVSTNGSNAGISYQLYNGAAPVGSPLAGTGSALDFGRQLVPGLYTVIATNTTTNCTNSLANSVTINMNPLPTTYTVTGGGGYCAGGTGVHVGLSGSAVGIQYSLYNGSTHIGSLAGTGSTLDFGLQTTAGTYEVIATNSTTTCSNNMTGSAIVKINALPTAYAVGGGGNYCSGGVGAQVSLAGSDTGVTYQLYNNGSPVGATMSGTGSALIFGLYTATGIYTIEGTNNTTGCVGTMSGNATIGILPAPADYTVTGGGSYCAGTTGVAIGLTGSVSGVHYQLYNGTGISGSYITGTGSAITFGLQTTAGSYSVIATNPSSSCTAEMTGSADVIVNALPTVYNVTGGGSYCSGNPGVAVGLSNSNSGISYQLYIGTSTFGSAVNGTGSALNFGLLTAPGTYHVYAMNNTTTCATDMHDSATIIENMTVVPSITLDAAPGDTVCAGTNVSFVTLTANGGTSPAYQWTVNAVNVSVLSNYNYVPSNGDVVTVTMTSSQVCATPATVSTSLTMTVDSNVLPMVNITANPGDTVCRGSSVTFTATSVYGGTPSYTWLQGSNTGTGPTYTFIPSAGDVIVCEMTSNYSCRTSNTVFSSPVTMQVDTPLSPSVFITATPGTRISQGQSDTLTASISNGGPAPTYQWYINGQIVTNATQPTFIDGNFNDGDSVTCAVMSSGMCGGLPAFNSVIIHINSTGVTTINGVGSNVTLVPNPNKGDFTVKGTLGTTADEEVTLEITDVLGQVMFTDKVMTHGGVINEHIQLNATVANGMYVLSLRSATDNKVFHVVVEQ